MRASNLSGESAGVTGRGEPGNRSQSKTEEGSGRVSKAGEHMREAMREEHGGIVLQSLIGGWLNIRAPQPPTKVLVTGGDTDSWNTQGGAGTRLQCPVEGSAAAG